MSERIQFASITSLVTAAVLVLGLSVGVFLIVLGLGLWVWSRA